jgi:hypothetical protein
MKSLDKLSEDTIQADIFKWYHNTYCTIKNNPQHIIFSVPNGGTRNKSEAMKLKATGLLAGVSDLIIIQPNKILFVEVKTSSGIQSDKQKDFERKVTDNGFKYILVRSLEDFKKFFVNL